MYQKFSGHPRLHQTLFFCAALIGLAFLFCFSFSQAQASLMHCRTDPIVTLSNGDVVTISVDINADPSQVQRVDYTLHVPNNVTATNIIYQDSAPGLNEHLTLAQDSDKEYKSETVVNTSKSVAVTVTMSLGSESDSATGKSGKKLTAVISLNNSNQ